MATQIQTDKFGGPCRTLNGEEQVALWLPMTVAEKEAVINKAIDSGVSVPEVIVRALRGWLQGKQLNLADLEKVAGGSGGQLQQNLLQVRGQTGVNSAELQAVMDKMSHMSTVMCPW